MAKLSSWKFFVHQYQRKGAPPLQTTDVDLSGKTVLVTGATSGVGLDAAKHFARMKPSRLILACRSVTRGKEVAEAIKNETGFVDAEVKILDQANFASVNAFADDLEAEGRPISILVVNIGVSLQEYNATNDGWEETLQVNHLSTALVTALLLPRLIQAAKEGSQPRIVVVASSAHYWANPFKARSDGAGILKSWNDKANPKSGLLKANNWYPRSKLLNVFFARELGERIPDDTPVTVISVCPGFCSSGITKNASFPVNYISRMLVKLFAYTSEEG